MNGRQKRGVDIDITSLIDVLFMLIIFFVLTASFLQGSIEIDLPVGEAQRISERDPLVVTVTAGAILWAGEAVSRDSIPALVARALAESDDILIAGDRNAPYGDVAELLDEMRGLGVESVGLAFEGDKK
ncbi:MAG: biopolymer transporter ExbD [Synergistaceae bacterium]|jgi:biopolymer transport protein ExbD|nr:biopolymer transporter ExbD [Synergistaceae bacterium]